MELIAGFEEMYAHLLRSRDNLLTDEVTLAMFDNLELRTLLRSTATYTRLQLRLLHPEFMVNGIDRSIELEWLARPLTGPTSFKCDRQHIYDHEREAMEKLDVPIFTTAFADLVSDEDSDPDLAFLCAPRDASFAIFPFGKCLSLNMLPHGPFLTLHL
jgi:lantibiotic modifying enzyme